MTNVSVFGLGKVGYTLACCLAAAGNRVIGCDPSSQIVEAVNNGTHTNHEADVPERFAGIPRGDLLATSSALEAVAASDISMVIVPTPSNTLGGFSLRFVVEACESIGHAIREKSSTHCVAIVSTMLPGASDSHVLPALEMAAGRKLGDGLGYCYNPSFIALGDVVKGFEQPDYVLIGQFDKVSGDQIERVHRSMIRNNAPMVRMKPLEAEITKIASNTHETMRVAFANMLFALCSELENTDVDLITSALAYRLGRRFFKGAVPYGGPCWPRDNRALAVFMDAVGVSSILPRTIDISNNEHGKYVLSKVLGATNRFDTVGLLGLSYKPGTHVIEGSFGIDLAESLLADGRKIVAWDPMALREAQNVLGDRISYAGNAEECLRNAKVVMIINPMPEFETIDWSAASSTVVMDPWRCLPEESTTQIGTYVAMAAGRGSSAEERIADDLAEKLWLYNS